MDFQGLFDLQLQIFFLMGAGFLLRKQNIITKEGKTQLTELIMQIILPCNIISSFTVTLDSQLLKAGFQILAVSIVLQIGCMLISGFCYNRIPKTQRMVLQYGTVCSNAGFLGNPVAEGIYGSLGLLYASLYLIPQRIVMWSVGVAYFTDQPDKKSLLKKVITHPCILAVLFGCFILATRLSLPEFLNKSVRSLGGCTTAITMLYIGSVLAEAGKVKIVSKITIVYSAIRLMVIPGLVLIGCMIFRLDATAAGVAVVLAAMPAGSTTAILAAKYDGDELFAVQCIVLTTLLSMVLLPAWCAVLNWAL